MMSIINMIVWIVFIFILTMFIVGFNKQQIEKHKDKLDERQKRKDDKTIID